jgi:hypothetical protein
MKERVITISICLLAPLLLVYSCKDILFEWQTDSMYYVSEGLSIILQSPIIQIDGQERAIITGRDSLRETLDNGYYHLSPYLSNNTIYRIADSCFLEKGKTYYPIQRNISSKGFNVELFRKASLLSSLFDGSTRYEALFSVVLTPKKLYKKIALEQGVIIADRPHSKRKPFYGTLPDTIISRPFVLPKRLSTYYTSIEGRYYLIPDCYWRDDDSIEFEPIEILNILPSETDSLVTTINGYPVFKIDLDGIKMQILLTKKCSEDFNGEIAYSGHLLKAE